MKNYINYLKRKYLIKRDIGDNYVLHIYGAYNGMNIHTLNQCRSNNMWATWCGPCVKEIPDFNKLQEKYGKDGLVVLSITDESPNKVEEFLEKHEIKTINGFIRYDDKLAEPFRNMRGGRPLIFIVDREGIVREGLMWVPKYKSFKKWLRS